MFDLFKRHRKILGVFLGPDDLIAAVRAVKATPLEIEDVYSPSADHRILAATGKTDSPVKFFTFLGGILGVAVGLWLSIHTALQWKLNVGGKPVLAWIPFSLVSYENAVIGAVIWTIIGLVLVSRTPRFRLPEYYDPRFTEDRYGLVIRHSPLERDQARDLLRNAGADEIHEY